MPWRTTKLIVLFRGEIYLEEIFFRYISARNFRWSTKACWVSVSNVFPIWSSYFLTGTLSWWESKGMMKNTWKRKRLSPHSTRLVRTNLSMLVSILKLFSINRHFYSHKVWQRHYKCRRRSSWQQFEVLWITSSMYCRIRQIFWANGRRYRSAEEGICRKKWPRFFSKSCKLDACRKFHQTALPFQGAPITHHS